jgi:hypothetical protein
MGNELSCNDDRAVSNAVVCFPCDVRAPHPSGACGVGVNFENVKHNGVEALRVLSFLPGGPAERSGHISIGDVLYSIDNEIVYGTKLENVVSHFLGARGTPVTLGVFRGDSLEVIKVNLRREIVGAQQAGGNQQVKGLHHAMGVVVSLLPTVHAGRTAHTSFTLTNCTLLVGDFIYCHRLKMNETIASMITRHVITHFSIEKCACSSSRGYTPA